MKTNSLIAIIIAGFLFVGGCSVVVSYNSMVTMDEGIEESWAQVENVYQRRSDLVPNLVNTVKGYAKHEKGTFEAIVKARAEATSTKIDVSNLDAESIQKFQAAQEGLGSALSKLLVIVENYPDLKANQNFSDLQTQLESTENRITVERRKFNKAVKKFNKYIRRFPANIAAGIFDFETRAYFEAEKGSEKVPEVKF